MTYTRIITTKVVVKSWVSPTFDGRYLLQADKLI